MLFVTLSDHGGGGGNIPDHNWFAEVLDFFASQFTKPFEFLNAFKLVGNFSMLHFIILSMVIDIIIAVIFVTFNTGFKNEIGGEMYGAGKSSVRNIKSRIGKNK